MASQHANTTRSKRLLFLSINITVLSCSVKKRKIPINSDCRLKSGLAVEGDPLPWDLLLALAVLDGMAGDGGDFWQVGRHGEHGRARVCIQCR